MKTPYIHCSGKDVLILGEPEGLEALGHALLLKARMGRHFQCTISDGHNIPIKIMSAEELSEQNREADK